MQQKESKPTVNGGSVFSNWLYFQEQGIPLTVKTVDGEFYRVKNLHFLTKHFRDGAEVGVVCGKQTSYVLLVVYSPLGRWLISHLSGNFLPTSMAWHQDGIDYILYNSCEVTGEGLIFPNVLSVVYDNEFVKLPGDSNVKLNLLNRVYESPDWLNTLASKDNGFFQDEFTSEALDWLNQTIRTSRMEQISIRELHRYYFVDVVFEKAKSEPLEDLHPITYSAMKKFLIFLGFEVKNDKINATLIRR